MRGGGRGAGGTDGGSSREEATASSLGEEEVADERAVAAPPSVATAGEWTWVWRPMRQYNVEIVLSLGLNHPDPLLRATAWELVRHRSCQPHERLASWMFLEPMEPAEPGLQWTSAAAMVVAQRELRVARVPQRRPAIALSRLQQRMEQLAGSANRAVGWRAHWVTEGWWWPGADDSGRSLALQRRVQGRWRRWAVIGASAHMASAGASGLGWYSWREGADDEVEWVAGRFDGRVVARHETEEAATEAAAEMAGRGAGNAYMMVFAEIAGVEWRPGDASGAPRSRLGGDALEALRSSVTGGGRPAVVPGWAAAEVRRGSWALVDGQVWRPVQRWVVVDGSSCGPPFVQEACDCRSARGRGRVAVARLRGGDRSLVVSADVPAYDTAQPVLDNAAAEVVWYYGPAYDVDAATQGSLAVAAEAAAAAPVAAGARTQGTGPHLLSAFRAGGPGDGNALLEEAAADIGRAVVHNSGAGRCVFLSWVDAWRLHRDGRLSAEGTRREGADALRTCVVAYAQRPEIQALDYGGIGGSAMGMTVAEAMTFSMLDWPAAARCGLDAGPAQWCQLMARRETFGDVVAHAIAATLLHAEAVLYGILPGSAALASPQRLLPLDGCAARWTAELMTVVGVHCVALSAVVEKAALDGRPGAEGWPRELSAVAASTSEGQLSGGPELAELRVEGAMQSAGGGGLKAAASGEDVTSSVERQRRRLSIAAASARPPGGVADDGAGGASAAAPGGVGADAEELLWADHEDPAVRWEAVDSTAAEEEGAEAAVEEGGLDDGGREAPPVEEPRGRRERRRRNRRVDVSDDVSDGGGEMPELTDESDDEGGDNGGAEAEEAQVRASAVAEELACENVWVWNARQLHALAADPSLAARFPRGACKLRWLERQIRAVQPEVVMLMEVAGSISDLRKLRKWFRLLGYEADVAAGSGGGEGGGDSNANGAVAAVRRGGGKKVQLVRRAARVWGVQVDNEHGGWRAALVHGLEGPQFKEQLRHGRGWVEARQGGVVLGDFNHVVCATGRQQHDGLTHALGAGDKALAQLAGWRCSCCSGVAAGEATVGGWVGGRVGERLTSTRWAGECGTAIDGAVAVGAERGRWRLGRLWWAADEGGELSDHALMAWVRRAPVGKPAGELRPRPLPVTASPQNSREGAVLEVFKEQLSAAEEKRDAETTAALRDGLSCVEVVARLLRGAGEVAVEEVREAVKRGRHRGAVGDGKSPQWLYRLAGSRLRSALQHRAEGTKVSELYESLLHSKSGLRRFVCSEGSDDEQWASLFAKLDSDVEFARAALRRAAQAPDRALVEGCQRAKLLPPHARAQAVWRLVTPPSPPLPLDALWIGDKATGREEDRVRKGDAEFLEVAGQAGDAFVRGIDKGAVPAAFQAWLQHFGQQQTTLRTEDGGVWVLEEQLTFDLFLRVLANMPRGKAVGAGGLSVELLEAAGEEWLGALHAAVLHDLRRGVLAPAWKTVLYALLVKKAPNNPECISERREIALMAQELKLVLQMVRWTSFCRLEGHVDAAQAGWTAGHGAADPGLTLQAAMQDARRTRRRLYILYIDLAQFFPRMNRTIQSEAELFLGLPPEVALLAKQIYGRGVAGAADAVRCQYDTADGLSRAFANHMGALMGCVLSPSKAKILLQSVLQAIVSTVRGYVPWGSSEGVPQVCFGDDWAGLGGDAAEVRAMWAIWAAWEPIVGAKIGIKGNVKTVLTGVDWRRGRAAAVENLVLRTVDGTEVGFLLPHEVYRHLGNLRRADGCSSAGWLGQKGEAGLRGKLHKCLSRLRRVRPGAMTEGEFMMVSDILLNGTAGFYLQSLYVPFKQLDGVEAAWRKIYARLFGADVTEPVVLKYLTPQLALDGRRGRLHLWAAGLAALYATVCKAMADVHDTPQRRAARSMVALAMHRWGCRTDPARWEANHILEALRASLEEPTSPRYLGDAFLLAMLEFEGAAEPERCEQDAWGVERRRRWGRWLRSDDVERGCPMWAGAAQWAAASPLLFQAEGLGLAVEPRLLEAGVATVGALCVRSSPFASSARATWVKSTAELRHAFPRIGGSEADEAALQRVLAAVVRVGASPAIPERDHDCVVSVAKAPTCTLQAVGALMRWAERDRRNGGWRGEVIIGQASVAEYAQMLAAGFGPRRRDGGGATWGVGRRSEALRCGGARVVVTAARGASWIECGGRGELALLEDEDGEVDANGCWPGWEHACHEMMAQVSFDDSGWPWWTGGAKMDEGDLARLPPAPQLVCRARMHLGAEAEVEAHDFGVKRGGPRRVNLEVQERNWALACTAQAKYGLTAAYSLDASRGQTPTGGDEEQSELRAGRAAVRHDGVVIGGRLEEPEGETPYLGEWGAQLDALADVAGGPAVVVMFDAKSPVQHAQRFLDRHDRARQNGYASTWFSTWEQLTRTKRVVVAHWQTSHVGSPANEWADEAAEAARASPRLPVPRLPAEHFSMFPAEVHGAPRRWATQRARCIVARMLTARTQATILRGADELGCKALPAGEMRALTSVRAARASVWDRAVKRGAKPDCLAARLGCAFGCRHADGSAVLGTFTHYALFCNSAPMSWSRGLVESALRELAMAAGEQGTTVVEVGQLTEFMAEGDGRGGLFGRRAQVCGPHDFVAGRAGWAAYEGRLLRTLAVAIPSTGSDFDKSAAALKGVTAVASNVARLALRVREAEVEHEVAIRGAACGRRVLRRCFRPWARLAWAAGPARREAFAAVRREARVVVREVYAAHGNSGLVTAGRVVQAARAMATQWVDGKYPPAGERAGAEWRLATAVRERQRRWWRRRASQDETVRVRVAAWREGFWHALSAGDAAAMREYVGLCRTVAWSGASRVTDIAVVVGARARAVRAAWGWWRAGQRFGPTEAREALGRQWKAQAAGWWKTVAARAMQRWGEAGSCSGNALADVGERYVISRVRMPRVGTRRRRQLAGEQRGLRPSRQGLWRAAGVVEVRVLRPGGVQVLVRWHGAWADSWEPLVNCSRPLRSEARAMLVRARDQRAGQRLARAAASAATTGRRQTTAAASRRGRAAVVTRRRMPRGAARARETDALGGEPGEEWARQALRGVEAGAIPTPSYVGAVLEAARGHLRGAVVTGWSREEARVLRDRAVAASAVWHGCATHAGGARALWEDEAQRVWHALPASCDRGTVWAWAACRAAGRAWGDDEDGIASVVLEPPEGAALVATGGIFVLPPAGGSGGVGRLAKASRRCITRPEDKGAEVESSSADVSPLTSDNEDDASRAEAAGAHASMEAREGSTGRALAGGQPRRDAHAKDRLAAAAVAVGSAQRAARLAAGRRSREAAAASDRAAAEAETADRARQRRKEATDRKARRRRRAGEDGQSSEDDAGSGEDGVAEAGAAEAVEQVVAAPRRRRLRQRGGGVPIAAIAGSEGGGWGPEAESLATAWAQAVGFEAEDLECEVAVLLGRSEWVDAAREEQRATVDFESYAWRRTCMLSEQQWSAACGEAGVVRRRSRETMLELAGRSKVIQGLFVTWLREFESCEMVRVEAGGEWRRDRQWLYSKAWCDATAIGNVAMRAACWLLGERLVVAWVQGDNVTAVDSVEAMASMVQPRAAVGAVDVDWTTVREGPWETAATTVLMEAGGLGAAWAWLSDERVTGHDTACECERGRLGPLALPAALTEWGICGGCDCELVRCGGCGLVRCSANCGVGLRGAPEGADREVRAQMMRFDPKWTDTIIL